MVYDKGSSIDLTPHIARDVENVFLDPRAFAKIHSLDGYNIMCVVVNDFPVQNVNAPGQDMTGSGIVIYASHKDVNGFAVDQALRVDGDLYTVQEVRDIQGELWRVKCVSNYA